MTLTVRYHAHHLELSGYGKAAAGYIEALEEAGVEVDVRPVMSAPEATPVDVAIYHTTPSRLAMVPRSPARRHVAVTTWETDPMPDALIDVLKTFDAVIMPSAFCVDSLWKRASEVKTFVVPHGFDPAAWPLRTVRPEDDVFTFYSIGAWGERKNMMGVLKAYLHAFTKADRTRLVLVIDKVDMLGVHSVLARSGLLREELPGLVIPDHRLSDADIVKLHQDGDCFVAATRAEGFGLPIFEAAVLGKPIITPRWGGQAEFLRDNYGTNRFDVPYQLTPVFPAADDVVVQGNQMVLKTSLPLGADCRQLWAEPMLGAMGTQMRIALDRFRAGALHDNHRVRPWFEENYSFQAVGERFVKTLQEIL